MREQVKCSIIHFSLPPSSPPSKWGPIVSKCKLLHSGKERLACEGESVGEKRKSFGKLFFFLGFWPLTALLLLLPFLSHTAQYYSLAFCTPPSSSPLCLAPLSFGFFGLVGCGEGLGRLVLSSPRRRWGSKVPFLPGHVSFYGCFFLCCFFSFEPSCGSCSCVEDLGAFAFGS